MKSLISTAVALILVSGCGGINGATPHLKSGKQPAAEAAYQSGKPASAAASSFFRVQTDPVALSKVDWLNAPVTTSAACPGGGTATTSNLTQTVIIGPPTGVHQSLDLQLTNCSQDGNAALSGTVHVAQDVVMNTGSTDVAQTLTGRVDISGDIADFVDMNITQNVSLSEMTATTGQVNIVFDGTVTNSSGTYTFTQEALDINVASLQAATP